MKIIKRVFQVLGGLLLAIAIVAVTKFYILSPKSRPAPDTKAPVTPELVAHGQYLANHVFGCTGCHSKVQEDQPGEPIAEGHLGEGRDFGAHPEIFPGHIRARNLTPDPETGLGKWTDGEILRAMREGVSKDGRPLFPMMPYLTYAKTISDDDGLAVIAYLRSIPPVRNPIAQMEVNFPISMFARAAPAPLEKPAPAPPASGIERGRWILVAGSCTDCHTTFNDRHEPLPNHHLAGGNQWPIPGKGYVVTANITSDKATGIGAYSDADLMRVFNEGIGKAGRPLYGMPWPYYKGMTEDDKKALIMALREVPAIVNPVPPPQLKL